MFLKNYPVYWHPRGQYLKKRYYSQPAKRTCGLPDAIGMCAQRQKYIGSQQNGKG